MGDDGKFTGLQYVLQRPSIIKEVKNKILDDIQKDLVHKEQIMALQIQIDSLSRTVQALEEKLKKVDLENWEEIK